MNNALELIQPILEIEDITLEEYTFRVLRQERNRLLQETDWWCCSDQTPTQEQLDYRKALRDLPSNASPSLDDDGRLTDVTWPEKP